MLDQLDLQHELGAHAEIAELTFWCYGYDAGKAAPALLLRSEGDTLPLG